MEALEIVKWIVSGVAFVVSIIALAFAIRAYRRG